MRKSLPKGEKKYPKFIGQNKKKTRRRKIRKTVPKSSPLPYIPKIRKSYLPRSLYYTLLAVFTRLSFPALNISEFSRTTTNPTK